LFIALNLICDVCGLEIRGAELSNSPPVGPVTENQSKPLPDVIISKKRNNN
jgi:hypothetical protein